MYGGYSTHDVDYGCACCGSTSSSKLNFHRKRDLYLTSTPLLFARCMITRSSCTSTMLLSTDMKAHTVFQRFGCTVYLRATVSQRYHLSTKTVTLGSQAERSTFKTRAGFSDTSSPGVQSQTALQVYTTQFPVLLRHGVLQKYCRSLCSYLLHEHIVPQ